ncbi:MAG: hypothetical protein QX189_14890 [Methylococcales bacterium]
MQPEFDIKLIEIIMILMGFAIETVKVFTPPSLCNIIIGTQTTQ